MVVSNRATGGEERGNERKREMAGKREEKRRKRRGQGWKSAGGGNDRHGYCKIYCSSSFRLVVIPDEERAIREAYGEEREGARSFSTLTSALSFPSSLCLHPLATCARETGSLLSV